MVQRAAPLAVLSVLVVAAAPCASGARSGTISVTGSPRHVAQGGFALLRYSASSSGTCGFSIRYADGTTQAFSGQRVSAQHPTWRQLQISETAPLGEATGTLSCAGSGSRVIRFALVRPTSLVAVLKSGFTQSGGAVTSYGLVLRNLTSTDDVFGDIRVSFVDTSGHAIGTDVFSASIPAGSTAYVGGETTGESGGGLSGTIAVRSLRLASFAKFHAPASFAKVHPSADPTSGTEIVDGTVTNATPSPNDGYLDYLTALREVQAVFFDSNGSVIGGAASPTWAEKLPPGGQRSFEIRSSVLPASSIASVELSGR